MLRKYHWSLFVYLFTFEFMMIQLSAIRQALAIAIFIYSIKYITTNKNYLKYILLMYFAGLIHTSGFFMLTLILFPLIGKLKNSFIKYFFTTITLVLLFLPTIYLEYVGVISEFFSGERYFNRIETSVEATEASLLFILYYLFYIFIHLYYSNKINPANANIFFLYQFTQL